MCVVSAVMDQYKPWVNPIPPNWPFQYPNPQPRQTPPTIVIKEKKFTLEDLKELLDSFHQAVDAAEKFDSLTGQPDCVDPEKAQLVERVAELEARLDAINEVLNVKEDLDDGDTPDGTPVSE